MPTSTETVIAYIPRTSVLDPNSLNVPSSSVKDITVDVQEIADVPVTSSKTGLSTAAKVGITGASVVGAALIIGATVALCVTMIKTSPTTTITSTTSTTVSTTTSTSTTSTTTTTTVTTTTVTTVTPSTAPTNLVGYRGNNYQNYTFTITGATSGGTIWGTTIYTDDSYLAMAVVHSGFVANNVARTITVMILPGQSSYTSSTQNGITSSGYGGWSGSYMIVGATSFG